MPGEGFKALADPTRRHILELLREGNCTAGGMPSASAPTMVKLRLLAKMTMLIMSSWTIMGVPRMMVVYT